MYDPQAVFFDDEDEEVREWETEEWEEGKSTDNKRKTRCPKVSSYDLPGVLRLFINIRKKS